MEPISTDSDTTQDLTLLAERLNETLRLRGANSAEQAFGLGCSVGFLPVLIVVSLLFLFRAVNLILALILLILGILVIVGVSMLISQQARTNGMRMTYEASVQPEINQYLAQHRLTRARFDTRVSQLLPHDAPLQAFLTQKEQE
jgi:hypothetical protein